MELPPAATLKGQGAGSERAARGLPALLLMAASVALAFVPPVAGIPLAAYAAVALLLLGGMAALPWLLGQLLRLVPQSLLRQPLALLPVERARRMRRSTTVAVGGVVASLSLDRKSTRLNSSHLVISYAVFCLKKKNRDQEHALHPR